MFRFLSCNYNKNGSELKIVTMEQMLMHCKYELPKNGEKGKYGSIFVYDKEEMGYSNDSLSTGVIVIDYDWISKETADSIFDGFDELCYYMPSLYAIQYSSSYFINPKKNGLHIYIKTGILNKYEFEFQATLAIHYLAALINKILGIDLRKENEDENVIDTHNCKMSQRVNLFYSPFWYNPYAVEFNPSSISTRDIEMLMKVYGFELDFESEKNIKPITPIYGEYNNRVKGEKLKIDRNFKIGKLSGNDIRFRISIIADILFGDKAKEFCDNNFYFEDNKSIYSKYNNKNKYCDELVKHWLEENGYIEKKNNREVNTYLSEFHEDILKEINGVNKVLVVAPTGCGKTHYINNLLAIEKNAVVITPFNITNHLYNNCLMVNSLYGGDIPNNKPIVMIWDQAIKYWEKIKDRFIIIDESHQLFTDRTYRNMAVELVIKLKEKKDNICFVTATPSGEQKWVDKVIKYTKSRKIIHFNAKMVKNVDWQEYFLIKNAIDYNWYDKIVLFDDMNAAKIYEKLVMDGYGSLISYIRADRKDTEDFIRLRDNEMLEKKVTICTCIAFNGLNFKNTNEKILVVGSIQQGKTTACQIIQQIGRIRNSKVIAKYFFNDRIYREDIDDKIMREQEHFDVLLKGCSEINVDDKWLDKKYVEAIREIQEYYNENTSINDIINDLNKTNYIKGYFDLNFVDEDFIMMTRAVKKNQSDNMRKDIIDETYLTKEYTGEYDSKWEYKINKLISSDLFDGIDFEFIKKYMEVIKKNKLIDSALHDIETIIRAVDYTDEQILELQSRKDEWMNMLSSEYDKKKLSDKIKTIIKYNKKYKDKVKIVDNRIYLNDVVLDVISQEEERMKREQEQGKINGQIGGKIGGKISSPKKKCIVTSNFKHPEKYNLSIGQEFESSSDIADYTNKSNTTISQWRNKGWIE